MRKIEFWAGQGVSVEGKRGTVVEVNYRSVKVWVPGEGAVDFLRPRKNSMAVPGAATVEDLKAVDSTAAVAKKATQLILYAEAFAVDKDRVTVASRDQVNRYSINKDLPRMEALNEVLSIATKTLG